MIVNHKLTVMHIDTDPIRNGNIMKITPTAPIALAILLGLFSYISNAQNLSKSAIYDASASSAFLLTAEGTAYADIADLVTIAPMILDAQITKVTPLIPAQTSGVPAHLQRALVEANILGLIRGTGGVTAQVRFLLDIPKDAKGKIPKLKKKRLFVLATQVAGRPGEIRLVRPNALIEYSPANDAMVRSITKEVVRTDALQRVTGITSAFYTPGTVIGEGETQIFLATEKNQPLALSIRSRPGESKIWAVSTSEVIDETGSAPPRFTLLWYRLACGLPKVLTPELVESGGGENAANAQADYNFVMIALGPCGRKRAG
jgi:hypothetical protein